MHMLQIIYLYIIIKGLWRNWYSSEDAHIGRHPVWLSNHIYKELWLRHPSLTHHLTAEVKQDDISPPKFQNIYVLEKQVACFI